ncbi:MAG: inorganic phosphate transporter [Deltaproteobacteria bacterium]|nr:inorganic phosphate transporter [Deltaproteobacteria bacterium]
MIAGASIAFANGQNDVSKGIATLVGSGVTNHRRAILWGSLWTGIGGFAGAAIAGAMITTFGNGLLASGATPTFATALAVVFGAAAWVFIATRTGLPVSTTHAIVGALTGVALVAFGTSGLQWQALAHKIALPLLLTPLIALTLTAMLLRMTRRNDRAPADCACVTAPIVSLVPRADGLARIAVTAPRLVVASTTACEAQPVAARVTMDYLHWLTSGAASFARGLNDAPKIVALIMAGAILTGDTVAPAIWFAVVTVAMVAGSIYGGLGVLDVLACRVTRMDHHEGFMANLVTATLVGLGAWQGLPLSTTHVSTGAIVGAGTARAGAIASSGFAGARSNAERCADQIASPGFAGARSNAERCAGKIDWRTVRGLLLAWIVTLPLAALLAVIAYGALRMVGL